MKIDHTKKDYRLVTPGILKELKPLIDSWATHYSYKSGLRVDKEDLIAAGHVGLMDAATRFDSKRKTLFKTFAEFRIRGAMLDELRKLDELGRSERSKQKIYRQGVTKLGHHFGRTPTREELAKVIPLKKEEIDRMDLYEHHEYHQDMNHVGESPDHTHRSSVEEIFQLKSWGQEALRSLPANQRQILYRHYFEDVSFHELAKEYGVTLGRISQLHREAINSLKQHKFVA